MGAHKAVVGRCGRLRNRDPDWPPLMPNFFTDNLLSILSFNQTSDPLKHNRIIHMDRLGVSDKPSTVRLQEFHNRTSLRHHSNLNSGTTFEDGLPPSSQARAFTRPRDITTFESESVQNKLHRLKWQV